LLWDAAEALGERDRDVLDLSLRHGLEPAEIADVIGLNRNAANQLVHRVRQRLGTAVGARVLWRDGQPTCSALRAELAAAGVDEFGADAVRVTDRHAGGCDECGERRQTHLSPAQLFSALPILVIPALKAQAAFALSAAGVPMAGSTALDDKEPVRHGRVRRGLLAGGVVVAVVIFALFMGAGALDRDPSVVAPVASTTSSSTSTSTSVTTAPATSTVPATVPVVVTTNPPTTIPTTTSTTAPRATTTTTAVVRATISLSPPTVTSQYAMQAGSAPQLTWTVTGASATRMYDGPGALDSTQGSGSQLVCPGAVRGGVCFAKSGTYAYTLDAFDSTGTRVVHRALTLTIN
jgi:hypothetical protein